MSVYIIVDYVNHVLTKSIPSPAEKTWINDGKLSLSPPLTDLWQLIMARRHLLPIGWSKQSVRQLNSSLQVQECNLRFVTVLAIAVMTYFYTFSCKIMAISVRFILF